METETSMPCPLPATFSEESLRDYVARPFGQGLRPIPPDRALLSARSTDPGTSDFRALLVASFCQDGDSLAVAVRNCTAHARSEALMACARSLSIGNMAALVMAGADPNLRFGDTSPREELSKTACMYLESIRLELSLGIIRIRPSKADLVEAAPSAIDAAFLASGIPGSGSGDRSGSL